MALPNNLRLLFLFCSLLIFVQSARSELPLDVSPPTPEPESFLVSNTPQDVGAAPSPSPSPYSTNDISSPPLIAPGPSALPPSADVDPKVKEICGFTDYPTLCVDTIIPHLKSKHDVPFFLEVSINMATKLAEQGLSLAKEIFEKRATAEPELKPILDDCRESYVAAVASFVDTKKALSTRDIGTMNSMLSAVITDVGDCEDGFSGMGSVSPFAKIADTLTNMTSNCLAIVSRLK